MLYFFQKGMKVGLNFPNKIPLTAFFIRRKVGVTQLATMYFK